MVKLSQTNCFWSLEVNHRFLFSAVDFYGVIVVHIGRISIYNVIINYESLS